ncbi:cytoskeleton-associated protein 2-like [Antedon mediterranea]|uniref:cytoskeleton-associated protein 2-like n=1 Tax=Antedon mediterranea TaxID=105859 RepID=UPI003AF49AA1
MLRKKQHEIMQKRLELWRLQKKTLKPNKPPTSKCLSTGGIKAHGSCGVTHPQQNMKPRTEGSAAKEQRLLSSKRQLLSTSDTTRQNKSSCKSPTIREKLEAWLIDKKQRIELEKSKIKNPPWNSSKRKVPSMKRIQWESEANIQLRDVEASKYLGHYGPTKGRRSTTGRQSVIKPRRKTFDSRENEEGIENVGSCVYSNETERGIRLSYSDLKKPDLSKQFDGNESKSQIDRRARLEKWLATRGKTTHSVRRRRSVRRETFDVMNIEKCHKIHEDETVELNTTIDDCLQSCVNFMNEMKCESKVGVWLQELLERCPQVRNRALFWICQAKIAEHNGVEQNQILALYEEAIDNNAKPTDILKSELKDFTIRHSNIIDTTSYQTPASPQSTPVNRSSNASQLQAVSSALRYCYTPRGAAENTSSVLRYQLVDSTPLINRLDKSIVDEGPQRFLVTPVRRSVRIEKSAKRVQTNPRSNRRCVASLQELPADMECLIMRPNRALEDEFTGSMN